MAALVIIGNGFDLAHGLKTGYSDFIRYLVELQIGNPDLEPALFNLEDVENYNRHAKNKIEINTFEQLIDRIKFYNAPYIYFKNNFLSEILDDVALQNWCDIEDTYFRILLNKEGTYIKDHNEEFKAIKHYLSLYLQEQEKSKAVKRIQSYAYFFNGLAPAHSLILNFNYTNTLDLYKEEIKDIPIIHIHGKLRDGKNPIIFGYAANDEESRDLSNRKDNELMRNIKKHCYKRANSEVLLNAFLEGAGNLNVFAFGHSFGDSDKLILNKILNHKYTERIRVFYYERYESYFQMQANIDRVMIDDSNFGKLINFQDSHRMPQKLDDDAQNFTFESYLANLGPRYF